MRSGLSALYGRVPPQAFAALFLALQVPALRPIMKFAPLPVFACLAVMLTTAALLWTLLAPAPRSRDTLTPLRALMGTPWPVVGVIVTLALMAAVVYPIADRLKVHMGGSDADDAMILAGTALMHGATPYNLTTYFGNPLSPGPGWAGLVGPLSALGLYPLLNALAVAILAATLRATRHGWVQVNAVVVSLFSCLLLWELAAVGNDLPAWGMLFLATLLALSQPRLSNGAMLGLAALLGALCTARIAFFYVPVLVGFSLLAVWPRRALWVAGVGTVVMGGLHAAFYVLNPAFYPPLHLLTRAQGMLHGPALYAALMLLGVVGIQQLYHWRWWPPVVHAAWGLGTPLFILALAELAQHGDLGRWEGATFWIPALPVVIYALLKPNFKG